MIKKMYQVLFKYKNYMYMIIFFLNIRQVYIGLSVPTNIRTTANMYVSSSLCVPHTILFDQVCQ